MKNVKFPFIKKKYKKVEEVEKMTKLKTLKDFKRKQYSEGEDKKGNKIKFFDERELKQEAIKHYKAVKNGNLVIDVLTYIRWANNLTEAELKNENFH